MQIPSTPSLLFLAYTLVFLPYIAVKSARSFRYADEDLQQNETNLRKNASHATLISLVTLLALAIFTADTFDFRWYKLPSNLPFCLIVSIISLSVLLLLGTLVRRARSTEERRSLFVYRMVARTRGEWAMKIVIAILAGVSEELAYRGVAMQILWYSIDNPWLSEIVISVSFAMAHSVQGTKSMALIFFISLMMHTLVAITGSLWGAICVHSGYDLLAMILIAEDARALQGHDAA